MILMTNRIRVKTSGFEKRNNICLVPMLRNIDFFWKPGILPCSAAFNYFRIIFSSFLGYEYRWHFLLWGIRTRVHLDSTHKSIVNNVCARAHAWKLHLVAPGFPLFHVRRVDRGGVCALSKMRTVLQSSLAIRVAALLQDFHWPPRTTTKMAP